MTFLLLSSNNFIGYGLTETSPTTHVLSDVDSVRKVGSIGILVPNLEARLLIDGDGDGNIEAGDGESGELWVRGPSIMKVCFSFLDNPSYTLKISRVTSTTQQRLKMP